MFLRVFFICRSILNYSVYSDAYFKKLCREYGFNPGVRFTFTCYLATYPERTIIWLFLGTIAIIAYVFRIFEYPFLVRNNGEPSGSLYQYYNSIYLTIITITTVGYGDFKPITVCAKLLIMITAIWGAFMISLVVLTVSSVFDLKKNQLRALKQIRATRSAAKTITAAMKFFQAKKKYYNTKSRLHPEMMKKSEFMQLISSNENSLNSVGKSTQNDSFFHLDLQHLRTNDMRQIERRHLREMVVAQGNMLKQLEEFTLNNRGVHEEQNEQEILNINKLVKAEVIDIAVMMDELTTQVERQENKINMILDLLQDV